MVLDGIVQTTERDEFIYHEMLAHVPVFAHGSARRVLIIGGGDGGMLREVIRHREVERVVQVEVDAGVIDTCREHLPNHSAGAFDDPRVEIVIADGARYVAETAERFEVVISDSTDPVGPGTALFSPEFYAGCRRCLAPGGVLVTQNGVAFLQPEVAGGTARELDRHFRDWHFFSAADLRGRGHAVRLGYGRRVAEAGPGRDPARTPRGVRHPHPLLQPGGPRGLVRAPAVRPGARRQGVTRGVGYSCSVKA